MPGVDLSAARLRRPGGTLFSQEPIEAAAPAAVLYFGSGAVSARNRLSARPTDRDAVHAQRRLPDPDRHALAVLAAGADALVERQIVADHADAVEIRRPVSDQHRPLEGSADFTVLNPVRLRALKDVLARRDIDLAAAEIDRVDAVLD